MISNNRIVFSNDNCDILVRLDPPRTPHPIDRIHKMVKMFEVVVSVVRRVVVDHKPVAVAIRVASRLLAILIRTSIR